MSEAGKRMVGAKLIQERLQRAEREEARAIALPSQRLAKFPEALLKKRILLEIQELDLSSNVLSSLPPKFVKLSQLRILRLSRNRFTDFPTVLCDVVSLKELYLDENQLSSIPTEIERLTALSLLNIVQNRIADLPKELGLLPALRRIELAGNPLPSYHEKLFTAYARQPPVLNLHGMDLDRVPDGIGLLSTCLFNLNISANSVTMLTTELFELRLLKELDLRKNRIKELPPTISRLSALRVLILSSNELTALPDTLSQLEKLHHLAISENRFTEFPSAVLNLPSLQELFIAGNDPGLLDIPEDLSRLQSLSLLHVKDNRIARWSCDLAQLPNLRRLNLAGNPISEASVEVFVGCNCLEEVDVSQTQLSIVQQKMIEAAVRKSPVLDLSDIPAENLTDELVHFKNTVTHLCFANNRLGTIPTVIMELPRLKMLDLSFNELGDLPNAFGECLTSVRELVLHHNRFEALPTCLGGLSKLRRLDLSHNCLVSTAVEKDTFTYLRRLKLGHNQINSLSEELLSCDTLLELDVSFNQLSSLPESISKLTSLGELYAEDNQLTSLPESITTMSELHSLRLTNNLLTSVPEELLDMNIILLSLAGNQLDPVLNELLQLYTTRAGRLDMRAKALAGIPAPLFKLAFIQELCLAENELTELPASICNIRLLWSLDLSSNQLSSLPSELGDLGKLRTLDVSDNLFTSIPWTTLRSPQLSILDFARNQLTSVSLESSDEVVCPLEWLNLEGNDLERLPSALYAIASLKAINIDGNERMSAMHRLFCSAENRMHPMEMSLAHQSLQSLPEEVLELPHLTGLDLSGNKFTELPARLAELPNLKKLDISSTRISSLSAMSSLLGLVELRATNCGIVEIPSDVYVLTNLQRLLLSFNEIRALPEDLSRLVSLQELHVPNNKIERMPQNLPTLQVLNVRRNEFNSDTERNTGRNLISNEDGGTVYVPSRRSTTSVVLSKSSPSLGRIEAIPAHVDAKAESAPVSPYRPEASAPIPVPPAIVLPEDFAEEAPIPRRSTSNMPASPREKTGKTKINRKFSTSWKKLSKRARTWTEIGARSPPPDSKRPSMSPRTALSSIPRRPSGFRVLVALSGSDGSLFPVVLEKKTYDCLMEAISLELGLPTPIRELQVMASPTWTLDSDKGVRNLEPNDVITVHI